MIKNAVKMMTANVSPQVAFRFGQRTCFSSIQAPLKYLPIGERNPKNFLIFGKRFLRTTFFLSGLLVIFLSFFLNTFSLLIK